MVSIRLWLASIYNRTSWRSGIADLVDSKNLIDDDVLCCGDKEPAIPVFLVACPALEASLTIVELMFSVGCLDNQRQIHLHECLFNDRLRSEEEMLLLDSWLKHSWFFMPHCPSCWCHQHLESEVCNFKMNHMLHKFLNCWNQPNHITMFQVLAARIRIPAHSRANKL